MSGNGCRRGGVKSNTPKGENEMWPKILVLGWGIVMAGGYVSDNLGLELIGGVMLLFNFIELKSRETRKD